MARDLPDWQLPTPDEWEMIELIASTIILDGYCPSYAEMAKKLGLKSKSGANRRVHSLVQKGILSAGEKNMARRAVNLTSLGREMFLWKTNGKAPTMAIIIEEMERKLRDVANWPKSEIPIVEAELAKVRAKALSGIRPAPRPP